MICLSLHSILPHPILSLILSLSKTNQPTNHHQWQMKDDITSRIGLGGEFWLVGVTTFLIKWTQLRTTNLLFIISRSFTLSYIIGCQWGKFECYKVYCRLTTLETLYQTNKIRYRKSVCLFALQNNIGEIPKCNDKISPLLCSHHISNSINIYSQMIVSPNSEILPITTFQVRERERVSIWQNKEYIYKWQYGIYQ